MAQVLPSLHRWLRLVTWNYIVYFALCNIYMNRQAVAVLFILVNTCIVTTQLTRLMTAISMHSIRQRHRGPCRNIQREDKEARVRRQRVRTSARGCRGHRRGRSNTYNGRSAISCERPCGTQSLLPKYVSPNFETLLVDVPCKWELGEPAYVTLVTPTESLHPGSAQHNVNCQGPAGKSNAKACPRISPGQHTMHEALGSGDLDFGCSRFGDNVSARRWRYSWRRWKQNRPGGHSSVASNILAVHNCFLMFPGCRTSPWSSPSPRARSQTALAHGRCRGPTSAFAFASGSGLATGSASVG